MDHLALTSAPSIVPPLCEAPVSPLDAILHKTADRLKTLRLHKVSGMEMDKSDAQALVSDLLDIARLVDPVVFAIGSYAKQFLPGLDLALFTDQLRDALEGNATFDLCDTVEKRTDDLREQSYVARHARRGMWAGE